MKAAKLMQSLKLFAALGPGDIVGAHRAQMSGKPIISETSIIYSGQLLNYCREQNIETLAISYNSRFDSLRDGIFCIENRPRRWARAGGIKFHLSNISYAGYLAVRAWQFGADLAIIDSGSAHYFALAMFRVLGIPVAVNFHNTLWPNGFKPKQLVPRLLLSLDAWFFRRIAVGSIGVSPECGRQVRQLVGGELPFFEYRAQYHIEGFQFVQRDSERNPFHILFVGRVERNKGVLDIATMAERLRRKSTISVVFDVCGDGSALAELKRAINEKGVDDIVNVHGRLARPELLQMYARAHAVIVPTRSDFCEGLPMTCAEGILSGLPLITSRLSNVIPVLGPALVEAEPENIESYVLAILKLTEDRYLYEHLSAATPELARQFLNRAQSLPAAIDRLIAHVFQSWKPLNDYNLLFAGT
jgi:glycosyltransferase involved in cell wall biosynthesis